jgi:hypothetical protein
MASAFPPYELLDRYAERADSKAKRLERLYHLTAEHAWDPRAVLDQLEAKHGGIHVPEDKREALGHLFSVILWGELAAWNIASDLALELRDVDAKMAATGQAFDEARHFTVLRDYFERAKITLPPLNPYGRRLLLRILESDSTVRKLYGMQLLVENIALSIFRQLSEANVEPVLTELLQYIERDESRHVALGVLYVPRLLSQSSHLERALNFVFNYEMLLLSTAGGELLDEHFEAMGLDHRALSLHVFRTHERMIREMRDEHTREEMRHVYKLSPAQQTRMVDFLHPKKDATPGPSARFWRGAFNRAVRAGARVMGSRPIPARA